MTNTSTPTTDIRSRDGHHLRRGYLELELTRYTGDEVPAELRANLSVIVQGLRIERGGRETISDYYIFGTKIPADTAEQDRRKIIVGLANKLTDEYSVSAMTDDLSLYDTELTKFGEYAAIATPSMFAHIDANA